MNDYLREINPNRSTEIIKPILEQARMYKTPIILEEGINFLIQLIKIGKVKKVLEIGTAIGYSAIMMALNTDVHIVTIERDEECFNLAKANIDKTELNARIELVFADAITYEGIVADDFDMIFIDAAKAQYVKFFEKYEKHLKPGGFIVTDNLLFHGEVSDETKIKSRNRRQLIKKIKNYNEYILSRKDYDSYIYEIGDGICLSIKK